jgi:Family of unknown function (DUF6011)
MSRFRRSQITAFWPSPIPIPPIPTLASLRLAVLERSTKRSPKWGFRLAPDLVMQLQPKVVPFVDPRFADRIRQRQFQFDGQAEHLVDGVVPANVFRHKVDWRDGQRMRLRFELIAYADTPDVWQLEYRRMVRACGFGVAWPAVRDRLFKRLADAFMDGTFDRFRPELMLSPACLCCGKALTDPASMARWIGPECFGSSSLDVPRLFQAPELAAQVGRLI